MKKEYVKPNQFYSTAVKQGDLLWVSGHIMPANHRAGDIEKELFTVFENLHDTLHEASFDVADISKLTVYICVKNQKDFDTFYAKCNIVYLKWCRKYAIKNMHMPARTVVGVIALPKGSIVEVETYVQKK